MDENNEEEQQNDSNGVLLYTELSFFVDSKAVVEVIIEMCSDNWLLPFTQKFEWLSATLSKYQEQPILLNPHLTEMLTPITERMMKIATSAAKDKIESSSFQVSEFAFFLSQMSY